MNRDLAIEHAVRRVMGEVPSMVARMRNPACVIPMQRWEEFAELVRNRFDIYEMVAPISRNPSVIAYCVTEGDAAFLCVLDDGAAAHRRIDANGKGFYRFPLNETGLIRLAAETNVTLSATKNIFINRKS